MPLSILDKDFPKSQYFDHVGKYYSPCQFTAMRNLLSTIFLYYLTLKFEDHNIFLTIICLILRAGLYVRFFVIMHDNGHEALFKGKYLNDICGIIVGSSIGVSYSNWKSRHNEHHRISNDLRYFQQGQSAPVCVSNFFKMKRYQQKIYLFLFSPFGMLFVLPSLYRLLNVILMIVTDQICLVISFGIMYYKYQYYSFWYDQCALQVGALIGLFFFHIQHTFENVKRKENITHIEQGLLGASFLQVPNLLKYFTFGIEYHHIHHLNAKVPGYLLKKCHDAAEQENKDYWWMVNKVGWKEIMDIKYVLYDEKLDRLISREELKKIYNYE